MVGSVTFRCSKHGKGLPSQAKGLATLLQKHAAPCWLAVLMRSAHVTQFGRCTSGTDSFKLNILYFLDFPLFPVPSQQKEHLKQRGAHEMWWALDKMPLVLREGMGGPGRRQQLAKGGRCPAMALWPGMPPSVPTSDEQICPSIDYVL